jgi:hypothetical protein
VSWLTWEAIKLFAKKAWVWCKHHWKIIALVIWTVVIWVISRRQSRTMMKVLETTRKSYQAEIDALNKTHAEEQAKKAEAIDEYHKVVDLIEEQYKEQRDKLTFEKKARIKELIASHGSDRTAFDKALREEFGFEHVE